MKTEKNTKAKVKLKKFISRLKMVTLALMIFTTLYFVVMLAVQYISGK